VGAPRPTATGPIRFARSIQPSPRAAAQIQLPRSRSAATLNVYLLWRYTVDEVERAYSKEITKVTGLIFIVAIGVFAAAVLGTAVSWKALTRADEATPLLLAGLAGGWGAGFSMLASRKGRLDAADH